MKVIGVIAGPVTSEVSYRLYDEDQRNGSHDKCVDNVADCRESRSAARILKWIGFL